ESRPLDRRSIRAYNARLLARTLQPAGQSFAERLHGTQTPKSYGTTERQQFSDAAAGCTAFDICDERDPS
ncbi:hypothetical protein LTR16_005350, partial [Cryomyces antarcticus]